MRKKITATQLIAMKKKSERITVMTAYDYSTAKLVDESGMDVILVGDSLGMVMLGYENTLQVTMEDMLHHTRAVARGTQSALVVGDMPFLSYHIGVEDAIRNAGRFVQEAGAHAVKLEGGYGVADKITGILNAQIPVLGHLGLTPQSVNRFGGFKVQGRDEDAAKILLEEALMLQELGVFGIVLECIPAALAQMITAKLSIPTIGIGAGPSCDGQVLVIQDALGMNRDFVPKFVKQYEPIGDIMVQGLKAYIEEVKNGSFPTEKHGFGIDTAVLEKLY